jgi:hypothetical protein
MSALEKFQRNAVFAASRIGRVVWLFLGCGCLLNFSAQAVSDTDVRTSASSFISSFYNLSGTNGYIKDTQTGGIAYFWGQAEMIECVIDAYEWNSNATCRVMITNLLNGFIKNNGANWSYNGYNDDIMWAVIAFARGGRDVGNMNYCNIAKANFDATFARAWDTKYFGGGLFWLYPDNASKNACVNGPAAIAASLLYQIYGDAGYWDKATNIYFWERSMLFNTNSGAIYDNIGTNGSISTWASTYNQGTFLGAANFLGQTNDAKLAANFTMTSLTGGGGILPEYGITGNNSGFNAIFLRWLVRFMKDRELQSLYEPWLRLNAAAAWNLRRADDLSWCQWLHPTPAGTNFYAWDCISSFEILQAAPPTETNSPSALPKDFTGYWPLDDASGTTAADTSGNGNSGAVSGATWSGSGKVNGCLHFNSANNNYVRVTNIVRNDFSLAFWVRTTQATSGSQWYNGAGLVDGDVSGGANDFGTAMCGGKFAFGVGNPDTTILSTAAINDGVWHLCVATRDQATGVISIYVDGNLQRTATVNRNSLTAPARLLFGAIASGGGYFNGDLDEVKIFPRALTGSEVAALYSSSLLPPPAAPPRLNATAGNGRIQLSWPEAAAATGYNIKRALITGGPYALIATNVAAANFTDTNVVSNRTYYYVVSAVNSSGESANSVEAYANPATLAVWFKADALTGLANGAAVSAWVDSTGNNFNALQPMGANQPVYVASAINGLPAVRFNAANNNYLWFYRPVQDDFTIILVYQTSTGGGSGVNFYNGSGLVNGEQSGTVNDFGLSLNANGQLLAGTGNPDRTIASAAGFANGQPHIVTFKRTKSSGSLQLFVDGSLVAAGVGNTQSLTAPNFLALGAQGTLNNFFTGDLAEVQIYNAALADADRLAVERALKCKYNLAGGAVPAVPLGFIGAAGNRRISLNWLLAPGVTDYTLWRSTDNGASYQLAASGLTASSYVDTNAVSGQVNTYKLAATDDCGASVNAAMAGIFLPLPALAMNVNAGALTLNWPGWAADWNLFAATNLTPPVVWLPVTNAVGSNDGAFSVTLPLGSAARFFRLTAP